MTRQTTLIWLVPVIAAVVFAADQLSKYWVSTALLVGQSWMPIAALEPLIRITRVQNSGAAFGMFPAAGSVFLAVAVIVVIGIVRYYYTRALSAPLWVRFGLGLMLGGALGNLIDRIRFGYVVDFFDLGWFPVFNVADSSIVIGVTLLAIYVGFIQPKETQPVEPRIDREPSAPSTT
ncbi:MAG: signal peptidase II [Chloroflexi bacterium]|nr:signal peptidase II [Chloroflexota bacterium]MBI3733942.1 signal peptidase II [Chloroflexota bacterium]